MTANERRKEILEVLCLRRTEIIDNLAFEFNVSRRTIRYDIEILSLDYPIYTSKGNGGGVYVDDNYRLGRVYLKDNQKELLENLLPTLNGKDAEVMKSILDTFGLKGERK